MARWARGKKSNAIMCVYKILNLITGDFYIGSSINFEARKKQHLKDLKSKTHANTHLLNAFWKYREDAFVFLTVEFVQDEIFLRAREQAWINRTKPVYNISVDAWYSRPENISEVRSSATKKLWKDPIYRANAISSRAGKSFNKGYKCTPEQILNRKKAARISNIKRRSGEKWLEDYKRTYPQHIKDLESYDGKMG